VVAVVLEKERLQRIKDEKTQLENDADVANSKLVSEEAARAAKAQEVRKCPRVLLPVVLQPPWV
jgi:hypothetical protein